MPQIVCPICHRSVHFHDRNKHQLKHIKRAKERGKMMATAPPRTSDEK
ncbi:MAG: hypothetical protein ABSA81_04110 [Candidatus Bathyarchaeia archaeon]|jgi:hypothetical protein